MAQSKRIKRSYQEPKRKGLSYDERWNGPDRGLITSWEVGRELREKNPELAEKAKNGELPVLGWKGGVDRQLKKTEKFGTLKYLAQWQGLRGEDLDIDLNEERVVVCSATGMKVTFTGDSNMYKNA